MKNKFYLEWKFSKDLETTITQYLGPASPPIEEMRSKKPIKEAPHLIFQNQGRSQGSELLVFLNRERRQVWYYLPLSLI